MADISMLSFDEDGAQTMLGSVEEIESAIASGRITRDTPVTVYMSDRRKSRHPAGEHPDMVRFFPQEPEPEPEPEPAPVAEEFEDDNFDPEPEPEAPAPAPTPAPAPAPTATKKPAPATADPAPAPQQQTTTPDYAAMLAEARARDRKTMMIVLGSIAGGIVLVGGAAWVGLSRGDSGNGYDYTDVADSEAAVEAAAADTESTQTFYLARWTNVRAGPSVNSADVGRLERGAPVEGTFTAPDSRGRQWFRLSSGSYAGNYISSANFMAVEPPPIDTTTAGEYRLLEATDILAGPSDSAPRVSGSTTSFPIAHKFEAFGGVNGFAEVGLEDGGVGYIPWTKTNASHLAYPSRTIFVRNNCRDTKHVVFSYRENGTWQTRNPLWTLPAGGSGNLQVDYRTINADTPEIYFHDFGSTSPQSSGKRFFLADKKTISINGQSELMRTAIPKVFPDSYQLEFC